MFGEVGEWLFIAATLKKNIKKIQYVADLEVLIFS